MKLIIPSNIPEAVDGFIKEKKQQNPLQTAKEKECYTTDTDDNASINNHIISNKGSNSNNDNNNINNVNSSEEMNINNNDCKFSNLDIENNISSNIDNKYGNNIKDNNINNKIKGHKISRKGIDLNASLINSNNNSKEVNISSNDGAKTSVTITSIVTTKETA